MKVVDPDRTIFPSGADGEVAGGAGRVLGDRERRVGRPVGEQAVNAEERGMGGHGGDDAAVAVDRDPADAVERLGVVGAVEADDAVAAAERGVGAAQVGSNRTMKPSDEKPWMPPLR